MEKQKAKAKLKAIKARSRVEISSSAQDMLIQLQGEGLTASDIANELGASAVSVAAWQGGRYPPSRASYEIISRVHRQVMFLKDHGIRYADIKLSKEKTLETAYIEAMTSPAA